MRGTPLAVLAMARALVGQGHSVDLLTFAQGDDVDVAGLRHRRSLRLPVGRVRPGPSLAKLLLDVPFMAHAAWRMAAGRYDVVHAVEEAAHLAAPLARVLHLPLVADVDSSIPDQLRYSGFATRGPLLWAAESLERFALRHAVAAITVCHSLTRVVRSKAPQTPVFQIEDPPLLDAVTVDGETLARLRRELGLGFGPVVLYAGNFEPYQGVELLVESAARVDGAQFLFLGGRSDEIAALKAGAGADTARRLVFAGTRPTSELSAFLGLADVVVSPRLHGTNTPFKIYTYLASNRPLVATRIESHTQLLDDTTAFLCEPTASDLAAAITRAVSGGADGRQRAANARALLDRQYSREQYERKVARAYGAISALAGGGRAAPGS